MVFAPKSRKISSTLFEMRELEHIMKVFTEEMSKEHAMCSDTILHDIAKGIDFKYFHNKPDRHRVVLKTEEIAKSDERFMTVNCKSKAIGKTFAADSPYVRGCISVSVKTDTKTY